MMTWWQNLPLFLILIPLICAAVSSVLKGKAARAVMAGLIAFQCLGMAVLLYNTMRTGESFIYAMGDIGAPFGNELRIGATEACVKAEFGS